jgi:hypothetical protein
MLVRGHPDFPQPADLDALLWRFLDLPKFLSLLHDRSLYFARGDRFRDPYEGMPPDQLQQQISNLIGWGPLIQQNRPEIYANCWHMSPYESAAMWKLYSAADVGIAITTTYAKLAAALDAAPQRCFLGVVRYGDAHVLSAPLSVFSLYMTKRQSFEHEQEVRGLIWRLLQSGRPEEDETSSPSGCESLNVHIDLSVLVERALLSPESPPWLLPVVRDIVARAGCTFPVEQSRLYQLNYQVT